MLRRILTLATPLEQKWFCRITLKDLKLGLSPERLLSRMHPDGGTLWQRSACLGHVLPALRGGDFGERSIPHLGMKLKPMLAERLVVDKYQVLAGRTFLAETKYDGERMLAVRVRG